jgi:uncharacterized protein (DUF697 family)
MTRKKLPRAITQSNAGQREIAAGTVVDEEVAEPRSGSPHGTASVGSTPAISSPPIAGELLPAISIDAEPGADQRRSEARKIVERHKIYAAVSGLFPLPVVNVAGVTAIIVRMVKALSDLYKVPFDRDRTRSITLALMGGAVPTGLAAATTSTLAFVVPGSGFVGLAVSSLTAAAFTRGIGLVFIEHFESGAMPLAVIKSEN